MTDLVEETVEIEDGSPVLHLNLVYDVKKNTYFLVKYISQGDQIHALPTTQLGPNNGRSPRQRRKRRSLIQSWVRRRVGPFEGALGPNSDPGSCPRCSR